MPNYEKELLDTAYPYWEAEAEIAHRFFAKATEDDHIFYLRAQLWKELNPVDGFFNGLHRELAELVENFPDVDKGIDRHQYHFLLMQLVQEFNHYVVLADIFEHLLGRPISPDDTVQLSEEKKLGELRRGYVEGGSALERAAVGLTEGGGSRLFREGAKLGGSELNDMTAKAMKVIYDDEVDHYLEQAREAARLIGNETDLARIKEAVRAVSRQRVNMRNEMFRDVMTEEEIETFIAARQKETAVEA
jgi:hypothetical protein